MVQTCILRYYVSEAMERILNMRRSSLPSLAVLNA